ncbi:hypothetical protein WMF26_07045 [Sorangium sp. So ce185]|uniref:hypothetical protein n=1 Tax=Sorangium sp. So ce185 TaxID=3133287 RepID=UPI003F610F82
MRTTLHSALLASLIALAGASACGGAVVVDGAPGGDDGSGGAGASATSSGRASVGAGPQSSSSSAAGSGGGARASCDFFCALFDGTACPDPGCRDACDELLSVPRPCNDLTAPFFDCMGRMVQIPSVTRCEQISAWLDPLFACMPSSDPACDPDFIYVDCAPFYEDQRACQLSEGR